MKILLFGCGPRLAWVHDFLAAMGARVTRGVAPDIELFDDVPTPENLVLLLERPVDVLVLVDHLPFAGESGDDSVASDEQARVEALRAVFAYEVGRRAARTLNLAVSDIANWVDRLADLIDGPEPPDLALPPVMCVGPLTTPLGATYLAPLFAAAGQCVPPFLVWPRESFLNGDRPGEILSAVGEVAGGARILAYGPYLPLPAGNWQATAFLGFSRDIRKMPFILEVDTGDGVRRGFFEVQRPGIFTLELEFEVADALRLIEFRLISQESAIEGQFALIQVALKPSPVR